MSGAGEKRGTTFHSVVREGLAEEVSLEQRHEEGEDVWIYIKSAPARTEYV